MDTSRMLMMAAGGYLLGLGILTGVAIDRMVYDRQRAEVLQRYEESLHAWQAYQMSLEKESSSHR